MQEKECAECHNRYMPTSNNQRKCAECSGKTDPISLAPEKALNPESNDSLYKVYKDILQTFPNAISIVITYDQLNITITRRHTCSE
jgi:hypothetical protein